jgi:hypothetical protein
MPISKKKHGVLCAGGGSDGDRTHSIAYQNPTRQDHFQRGSSRTGDEWLVVSFSGSILDLRVPFVSELKPLDFEVTGTHRIRAKLESAD